MRTATRILAASAAMLSAHFAFGQAYPEKPIHVIPGQPGGGTYVQFLAIRDALSSRLGQPIIMDATPGNLMGGRLARAQPDGYTIMSGGASVLYGPLLENKIDYNTLTDFVSVATLGNSPSILVINPSLPVSSVKELIAYAKAKPGVLNYSSSGVGSSYHITAELFKSMAGVDIVGVNYGGAGPVVQAVVSGEVQMTFGTSPSVSQIIKSGRLKALAHTGAKPTPLAPGLPSMAASGVPGFELSSTIIVFAPIKTPDGIVRRLNQEINLALAREDVKTVFMNTGADPLPSTPEESAARVRKSYTDVEKLLKGAGVNSN